MAHPMMIALVVVLFLQERLAEGADAPFSTPAAIIQSLSLLFGITLVAALRLDGARRHLDRTGKTGAILTADRVLNLAPMLIVVAHCLNVLVFHWLEAVRDLTGDLIFVDEALVTLPPLLAIVAVWFMYYPIERRVRQALLMRHLDRSLPVPPTVTRWQYVVLQVRHQFLLTLLPLALIVLWVEIVHTYIEPYVLGAAALGVQFAGVVTVFLIAPVLIRYAWDTVPLGQGELRHRLRKLCKSHRAGVQEILVWRTHGGMINGAVMGLIAPLRYVLLTDGLIESMSDRHIEAVMAHEIGHIRRKHLPTLVGLLMICVSIVAFVLGLATQYIYFSSTWWWIVTPEFLREILRRPEFDIYGAQVDVALTAASLIVGLVLFGYISRRFERQADTFAVQHLSRVDPHEVAAAPVGPKSSEGLLGDPSKTDRGSPVPASDDAGPGRQAATPPAEPVVTMAAAEAMAGALEAVARLNHIQPARRSWRHGSIRWRQRYLRSIVGKPLDKLPIDRLVLRYQIVAIIGVVLVLTVVVYDLCTNPEFRLW